MFADDKLAFQTALNSMLKTLKCSALPMSASKFHLKFRLNKVVVAELYFLYSINSRAYYLSGMVTGGPVFERMQGINAPYRSNLNAGNPGCFSFCTSGRQDKKFSPRIDGVIPIPPASATAQVCEHIKGVLENHYIPLITGCIFPDESTLAHVLEAPGDYSYPAVFVHCAAACNPDLLASGLMETLRTRRAIVKNKASDLALLQG